MTTMTHKTGRSWRTATALASILPYAVIALLFFFPGLALADAASELSEKAGSALAWIKTAVYFILVVAVIGSGVMAAFGRLSWMTVGTVMAGSIISGIGAEVVTALYGPAS